MPSDFFVRHDLLAKDRVAGYCVGIGVKRSPHFNLFEVAIDYEYRQISHSYGARAASSTSWFLHGICAVYRLDRFFEIFEDNWSMPGGLPFGEDGYAGITARQKGYRLLQDNHNMVHTFCPDRYFPQCGKGGRVQGYGASSLWKQRACRWYLSWPRGFTSEIHLFFTYKAGSFFGNIQYRLYVLWRIFLDFVGVIWIPFFFYILLIDGSWDLYFFLKGMLVSTSILSTICRILVFPWKLRKGIHPMAPFVTPVFTLGNDFLRFCSFFICMFWYIPFVRIGELKFYENSNPAPDLENGDDDETESYYNFGAPARESKSVTASASTSSKASAKAESLHEVPSGVSYSNLSAGSSSIASNEDESEKHYEFDSIPHNSRGATESYYDFGAPVRESKSVTASASTSSKASAKAESLHDFPSGVSHSNLSAGSSSIDDDDDDVISIASDEVESENPYEVYGIPYNSSGAPLSVNSLSIPSGDNEMESYETKNQHIMLTKSESSSDRSGLFSI